MPNQPRKMFRDKKYQDVLKILAKHDPVKLIKSGSPKDEYSPEAAYIVRYLIADNFEDFYLETYEMFLRMFSSETICGPKQIYKDLCQEIWNKYADKR